MFFLVFANRPFLFHFTCGRLNRVARLAPDLWVSQSLAVRTQCLPCLALRAGRENIFACLCCVCLYVCVCLSVCLQDVAGVAWPSVAPCLRLLALCYLEAIRALLLLPSSRGAFLFGGPVKASGRFLLRFRGQPAISHAHPLLPFQPPAPPPKFLF